MNRSHLFRWTLFLSLTWLVLTLAFGLPASAQSTMQSVGSAAGIPDMPLWGWPLIIFAMTLGLGVLAVMGGIGGAVLFVPLASSIMPFLHIDFIRGAGLMIALTGALSAGPGLLRQGLANLRLALPVALIASAGSIVGAMVGLALPPETIQLSLGIIITSMSIFMLVAPSGGEVNTSNDDPITRLFGIEGRFTDTETGKEVLWRPKRMILGLILFTGVGFMAGMFGLGAGWANVPVLNLIMGVPLKIAVGTSYFLLAITDTSAAWVYLTKGALLPYIAVPAVAGIMIGARLGSKLLVKTKPAVIKKLVIGVLFLAGLRALLRGLGI